MTMTAVETGSGSTPEPMAVSGTFTMPAGGW